LAVRELAGRLASELEARTASAAVSDEEEQRLAEAAREDVNVFCEFCFSDETGQGWRQASFHREWHQLIDENDRVQIWAPREHAKSTQMCARIIWELGRNPNLRCRIVAANDDLAKLRLGWIKRQIERNPRVRMVFPSLQPDYRRGWEKTAIYVRGSTEADPSVDAAGVLSTGTGTRCDFLVGDDVVDQRNAILQPALRQAVKEAWREVWTNTLTPRAKAVYICTPWHLDDLSYELAQNPEWVHWRQTAIIDEDRRLTLWPERWPWERLMKRRREIGERAFARNFLLQALSSEEEVFPESYIAACLDYDRVYGEPVDESWPRVAGVDLASRQHAEADYTVIVTAAVDPAGRRHLVEIVRERVDFAATLRLLVQQYRKHRHAIILVENNSYQDAVLQALRDPSVRRAVGAEGLTLPLRPFTTGRQKADETLGLPGLAAKMEQGVWRFPAADWPHEAGCNCAFCALIRELRTYPVGEHDDTVMALWFADHAAEMRRGGVARVIRIQQGPEVIHAGPPAQRIGPPDEEEAVEATDQLGRPVDASALKSARRRARIPVPSAARRRP